MSQVNTETTAKLAQKMTRDEMKSFLLLGGAFKDTNAGLKKLEAFLDTVYPKVDPDARTGIAGGDLGSCINKINKDKKVKNSSSTVMTSELSSRNDDIKKSRAKTW